MADEKQFIENNAKELEKHDGKAEEKDLLSSIAWSFALMWAGLVFLAYNLGWFEQLGMNVDARWGFTSLMNWRSERTRFSAKRNSMIRSFNDK